MNIRQKTRMTPLYGTTLLLTSQIAFAQTTDNKTNPVLLVHGFESYYTAKTDCANKFKHVKNALKQQGFTGDIVTVTYYKNSTNCDVNLTDFDQSIDKDSTWKEIGAALSRYISQNYSIYNQPVDLLGHSMGGIIIRSAVQGGSEYADNFSPILVDDAVTIAAPHSGVPVANLCSFRQCNALGSKNPDFNWLRSNGKPNGLVEVDWSVQGSRADAIVAPKSAMAMSVDDKHKKLYTWFSHNWQLIDKNVVNHAVTSLGTKAQ